MQTFTTSCFLLFLFISLPMTSSANGVPPPEFNPVNGHYYQCYIDCDRDWFDARDFASQQVFMTMQGHLATVNNDQEQQFITNDLDCGDGWLGGIQAEGAAEPDEDWEWITGEPFDFTAWNEDEPNDAGCEGEDGCENCLEMDGDGWNDQGCFDTNGCIIEFEPSFVLAPRPIPTISEWGLIVMAGVLGIIGLIAIRRRKVTA